METITTTRRATKHLTNDQRQQLRNLVDGADLSELLHAVAGIVSHDVADYSVALDAGDLVRRAATMVAKAQS